MVARAYGGIISPEYRWEKWAVPRGKDGKIDHHKALTGDDLKDFVDHRLFPYLKKFKTSAESAATIEYKIGEIFNELKNKIQSGYNLREVINRIDELRFRSHAEKHEMSHLYEDKIKNMGMLLPAIDGQQQIGDETTKYLNHEAVFASGNQVIHLEVAFPPAEEGLYVPAQFINLGHFFSRQATTKRNHK